MIKFDSVYAQIRAGDMSEEEFQAWVKLVEVENYCSGGLVLGGIVGYCGEDD